MGVAMRDDTLLKLFWGAITVSIPGIIALIQNIRAYNKQGGREKAASELVKDAMEAMQQAVDLSADYQKQLIDEKAKNAALQAIIVSHEAEIGVLKKKVQQLEKRLQINQTKKEK